MKIRVTLMGFEPPSIGFKLAWTNKQWNIIFSLHRGYQEQNKGNYLKYLKSAKAVIFQNEVPPIHFYQQKIPFPQRKI